MHLSASVRYRMAADTIKGSVLRWPTCDRTRCGDNMSKIRVTELWNERHREVTRVSTDEHAETVVPTYLIYGMSQRK